MATKAKVKRKAKAPAARGRKAVAAPRAAVKRRAVAAAVAGPVTLDEAQALARARAPRRALRRRAAVLAGPTAATVGEEQQRLRAASREERARRKREYRDVMAIMKKHGARRAAAAPPSGRRRAPGAAAPAFQPLQVFAEGDSWFDYPVPLFGGGIVPRLQGRLGVPILNMADAGDEVRFMLGVEQRRRLVECLIEGCPAGGPWDVMLFSGGGNDIVDNPMALWIRDWRSGQSPEQLLHRPRFETALALVRAGYEDLVALRDALSPGTHLVLHQYDFAIPDGRGICNKGPWMKPTFDLHGFPDRDSAFAVVKVMLGLFADMLDDLAAAHARVTVVRTQGTLAETPAAWHNELHPQKAGFNTFADMFRATLKGLFPDRVA